MLQTLSCVSMPLGTWVELEVHSYYALTYLCAGSCMCPVQATPVSKGGGGYSCQYILLTFAEMELDSTTMFTLGRM